jgi:hypothetical protein
MEKNTLKQLLVAAARPNTSINFADAQSAAKNALIEHFGISSIALRDLRKYRNDIFAIIEEVIEEVLPVELESRVGQFAEIKSFGREDAVKFTIKGLGKNRIARSIVKGARGGLYRAHRLDDRDFMVTTEVWTVGYQITLEELLSGRRTVGELIDLIAKGYVELIYVEVVKALRAAYSTVPSANKATGSGVNEAELQRVLRTIKQYGNPIIIGFESETQKLLNVAGLVSVVNPNIAAADLDEIRNNGQVSIYRGTPIVNIPNYFMDESNAEWMFKEQDLFILPVAEKPVKVAMHGDIYTAEVQQPHGGMEWSAHRLMGVGILFYNNIGLYRDTANTVGLY